MWASRDKHAIPRLVFLWTTQPERKPNGDFISPDGRSPIGTITTRLIGSPPEPGTCIEIEPIRLVRKSKVKRA